MYRSITDKIKQGWAQQVLHNCISSVKTAKSASKFFLLFGISHLPHTALAKCKTFIPVCSLLSCFPFSKAEAPSPWLRQWGARRKVAYQSLATSLWMLHRLSCKERWCSARPWQESNLLLDKSFLHLLPESRSSSSVVFWGFAVDVPPPPSFSPSLPVHVHPALADAS